MTTSTSATIATLTELVKLAKTPTSEGRQVVANSCKELYNLIEEDVYKTGNEFMLKGMYSDLCTGNFAEPFMCEQKKSTFNTMVLIYNQEVAPKLN